MLIIDVESFNHLGTSQSTFTKSEDIRVINPVLKLNTQQVRQVIVAVDEWRCAEYVLCPLCEVQWVQPA